MSGGLNGVFGKVTQALNDGHTTSGMDAAMQAHADKLHPVDSGNPDTKIQESTKQFPKNTPKPAGGYALKLPSDGP